MSKMFTKDGRLKFPGDISVKIPEDKYGIEKEKVVLYKAFCQNGHNLMSNTLINGYKGINLIYKKRNSQDETEIVISAIIGDTDKKIIKGNPFENGEEVQAFCPECHIELPILVNCNCQAPIYIFYMDEKFKKNYAQSFCSRIGCSQSSKIRLSKDVLNEFLNEHLF